MLDPDPTLTMSRLHDHRPPPLEFSAISAQLAVGSAPRIGNVVAHAGFRYLILCAAEFQPPDASYPNVMVARVELHDDDLFPAADRLAAHTVARWAAERLQRRERVLITCTQGRNRSAYVAALAIHYHTPRLSGAACISIIRAARRSPYGPVLVNPDFVADLRGIK